MGNEDSNGGSKLIVECNGIVDVGIIERCEETNGFNRKASSRECKCERWGREWTRVESKGRGWSRFWLVVRVFDADRRIAGAKATKSRLFGETTCCEPNWKVASFLRTLVDCSFVRRFSWSTSNKYDQPFWLKLNVVWYIRTSLRTGRFSTNRYDHSQSEGVRLSLEITLRARVMFVRKNIENK